MNWQGLPRLSLVAFHLLLAGCQSGAGELSRIEPDLPGLLGEGPASGAAARGQKPDRPKAPVANPLNLPPDAPAGGTTGDRAARIRAVVNGEAILDEEVSAAAFQDLMRVRSPEERSELLNRHLNELIDREVVLQDAFQKLSRAGGGKFLDTLRQAASKEFDRQWLQKTMRGNKYTDEKEFRKFLAANGVPLDMIRRQWERNFIAMEYMRHRIDSHMQKIGHPEIEAYYKANPREFAIEDSVEWQDLFISEFRHKTKDDARKFAEVLRSRMKKGEDFARLAKEHDDGDSSLREGARGVGMKRGEISPPAVEPIIFALADEEVGPLVEIAGGFHVVKLLKRTKAGVKPFDEEVQKQIRDKIRNQVFAREMKRIVAELKRKAIIEIATEVR